MKSKACLGLVVMLITALMGSVALADARDHFKRGQAAYQQGNYDLAITEWRSGYALEQRPEFQYNLAQAYERLGRLQEAVDSLQKFVESADPDDASYSDATARLASLQQRLALTGVRVLGGQDGAAIFVDGRDWGRLPRPDKISVAPGSHQIVIKLQGYKDFASNVVIPAGQVIDLEITMEPGAGSLDGGASIPSPVLVGGTPGAAATPPPSAEMSRGTSPWLYVGIASAVVTGVSLVGFVQRSLKANECEQTGNFCQELDAVKSQRALWGVLFGVGAVATAGSFILFALDNGPSESATAACAPGILGASCVVKF